MFITLLVLTAVGSLCGLWTSSALAEKNLIYHWPDTVHPTVIMIIATTVTLFVAKWIHLPHPVFGLGVLVGCYMVTGIWSYRRFRRISIN